jgi:hypothetical protein
MLNFRPDKHRENQNTDEIFSSNDFSIDRDLVMEQILKNINTTPIGQVLKKIASLPEVRQEKVLGVRRQITQDSYDLDDRLNTVLDKVLEDLTK